MTTQIVISSSPGERRYARLEDGQVVAIRVARDDGAPYAGAVYLGRVTRLEPGIGAAFVEIGLAQPGFLNLGKHKVSEGEAVVVRVKADPQGEKGARLSLEVPKDLIVPQGAMPPLRLMAPDDPLDELQTKGQADEILESKPASAQDPFETSGAAEALEEALGSLVRLPSGGRLLIERTAALTAIDVDSGAQKGADSKFQANREAALAVAHQIRLRNLAGRILVDFTGLPRKRLGRILELLKAEAARDETPLHIGGITPLGLVELSRERRTPCLADLFQGPEAMAYEGLRRALALVRANPAARPRLAAPGPVLDLLKGRLAAALKAAETRLGHAIILEKNEKFEVSSP